MTVEFSGPATPLDPDDIKSASEDLGCSDAAVRAVCDVEASGKGFLNDKRPKILFEAHSFYSLTKGRFGHSNISSPTWDRSLYGASGAHQYDRLAEALKLDRSAALQSASWGMFQVMGSNYKVCGFENVEDFVASMCDSEGDQLDAFVEFCISSGLDAFLASTPPNFAAFAKGYNGPGYAQNAYDTKLAAAYRKHLQG